MNNITQLEGSIENIIYRNKQNGYTIFSVAPGDGKNAITCTAYTPDLSVGENVRLTGVFVVHPSYGKQFTVHSFEYNAPSETANITKYLGSGVIKGIGERLARKITDMFGEKTLTVIENNPEELAAIPGISLQKAVKIGEVFKEKSSQRTAMIYLQNYGISPVYAQKIYEKYKDNAISVVKNNPYALADNVYGIGFKTADGIASKVGIPQTSEFRVMSGIKHSLSEASSSGHVYLERNALIGYACEMLSVPEELVENCLMQMRFDRQVFIENIDGEVCVYLHKYFYAESFTAKKLLELQANISGETANLDEKIGAIEEASGVALAENQKQAVREALSSGVLVITGGPGTGKTTVINTIITLLTDHGKTFELAAPTGRAAKRLEEATGREAKTIHRMLGMTAGDADARYDKNEDSPLEADVIIIDESSMVDITLMCCLLKAIPHGSRLILAGDADQLPSVGPGNVLKDIIQSGAITVVKLTEIFRQAGQSEIVMNAHRINNGERPVLNEKNGDFFFLRRTNANDVITAVKELVAERLPAFAGTNSTEDIQVLSPMRKSQLGSASLNQVLQEAINPPSPNKKEKAMRSFVFREGDKVMQIKNNYNLMWRGVTPDGLTISDGVGVYNGDEGIIIKIDDDNEIVRVRFDGSRIVDYKYTGLEELELSYAVTIHKSQGSEYKIVVIPIHSGPPALLTRNLLYTAVTRARKLAVIVGVQDTLYRMVDNNREIRRFSALAHRIQKIKGLLSMPSE